MKRAGAQHGLSLVEATIILMALMVLGGVLAPSIKDYIDDARMVKVKEDCEAIGLSVVRLLRDVGPCIKMDGRLPCSIYNRADLLVSEGHEVEGYSGVGQTAYSASSAGYTTASYETTATVSGGSATVNYVTEYVPRPAAAGTVWTDATHLGGSTAFYAELVTSASLKRMVDAQGLAGDIRAVLRESGLAAAADGVISTLESLSTTTTPVGSLEACSRVELTPGQVVECQLEVGDTLYWMAYRPGAPKGDRTPGRLEHVRWAGKAPVRSFAFRVDAGSEAYTFVVPAPCANLSLMTIADIRQREVRSGGTATETRTVTATARHGSSYSVSRSAYGSSQTVWANVRSAIGWFNTPIWAGTRFGHPNVDSIENQLIRNWPSGSAISHYAVPTQADALIPGPRFGLGWRGAYLSQPIGDDPWGHKYFVNSMFLFAFGNDPGAEGYSAWSSDTVCLSAGPNGWVETPFASYGYSPSGTDPYFTGGTVRGGDDFVYVIAGSSR